MACAPEIGAASTTTSHFGIAPPFSHARLSNVFQCFFQSLPDRSSRRSAVQSSETEWVCVTAPSRFGRSTAVQRSVAASQAAHVPLSLPSYRRVGGQHSIPLQKDGSARVETPTRTGARGCGRESGTLHHIVCIGIAPRSGLPRQHRATLVGAPLSP